MAHVSSPSPPTGRAAGLFVTLRAGWNAGLMNGLLFGLADGVVAGRTTGTRGFVDWLGCLGLAVLVYGAIWAAAMTLAGAVAHRWLRGRDLRGRYRLLLALAFGLGLSIEAYWWSRPYVYSGLSALDPRRLAFTAGLVVAGVALGLLAARAARRLPRGLHLAATIAVPLLWLAGGAYLLSLRASTAGRGAPSERNRGLPNVLLVVCDALRADVLGAYGSKDVRTPVLDALAARGVVFESAIVTAPFTWSSFGSILTGKYPRRHGLVKMDPGLRMRTDNVTLPWHLKSAPLPGGGTLQDEDFFSATFMTGTLSHGSGLARGFDVYYEALVGHDVVDTASPWSVFRSQLLLSILRDKLEQRFDASRVVTVAREWLVENHDRRFVAMVHLYSTHTPYDPPRRFREQYCAPDYAGPVRAFYAEHRKLLESGKAQLAPADAQQIRDLYEAGVAHADEMIGELIDELRAQGRLDDTLVIVTSDHGEELGEHGLWEHNWPYQTNLLVPWIMAWPGGLPAGARVKAGVQLIDLLPTVADLLRIGLPVEASGEDPRGHLDGASLLPLVRGEVASVRPFAFSENQIFQAIQDTAAEGPRWKLVVDAGTPCEQKLAPPGDQALPPQLFRLDQDPDEKRNVFAEEPQQAARLLAALCAWDASMPIAVYEVQDSDRDLIDQQLLFRNLGYADGPQAPPPAASNGK